MTANVMFGDVLPRFVRVFVGLTIVFLAACATAAPESLPTASPEPAANSTSTVALAATPTTPPPSATASASPQPSATPAPSATVTVAASATAVASATALPSVTAAQPTAKPTAADFTPVQVSVWNTALTGPDNMQGTCSNPVNPAYGLVQVTPQGSSLIWKNQEPAPYTMARVRASLWQYSGPTSIGDGTVTMVVQFLSATTLQLTRTFVSNAEPNCTHVHHYTGEFQWNR